MTDTAERARIDESTEQLDRGDLRRAPAGRTALMMLIGAVAAIWALASLLTK